jgi:alpha-galactosidase
MPKITFIGAGSTVFAKNLLGDIFSFAELADSHICLFDIDPERLRVSERVAQALAASLPASGRSGPRIEATLDRRKALDGADYAINMIQVAGYEPGTVIDFEIPKKYGLRQTIADTLGIGGIMRGLRTIPVLLDICRDMEEICSGVTFLNYTNPMAINCWAISGASAINTVGLCHSVQSTARELCSDIGVPVDEVNYLCAGINHMAFYLRFERDSQDLYPLIRQVAAEGRVPPYNRVRYEILSRLGYFVTESSEHFSEYVPWFIKRDRPDLIEQFNIPLDEYIARCKDQITGWEGLREELDRSGTSAQEELDVLERYSRIERELWMRRTAESHPEIYEYVRARREKAQEAQEFEQEEGTRQRARHSGEYASLIIHSMETGQPRIIYGNVPNYGLIDNLPPGCCVEVPCLVDRNGVQPVHVGALPPHLAALIQTNVNVQALTVEAALTRKREHIYHAAMLDPHTAAELDLSQIWSLVDELIEAHGDWLPEYH